MAYTRKHMLRRVIEVQEITSEYLDKGSTYVWIWKNKIYPRFHIAQRTFENWIGMTGVKTQLEEIEAKDKRDKQARAAQLKLFNE